MEVKNERETTSVDRSAASNLSNKENQAAAANEDGQGSPASAEPMPSPAGLSPGPGQARLDSATAANQGTQLPAVAVAAAGETVTPEQPDTGGRLTRVEDAVVQLQCMAEARLTRLADGIETATKQLSLIPQKVLSVERKVMDLTGSISEPRYRALLEDVLRIYDLVDQLLRGLGDLPGCNVLSADRRNYGVLKSQLLQILRVNGLSEIETAGKFDPEWHCAMGKTPTSDPAQAGMIANVSRPGFRTEGGNVLRFAEVNVYALNEANTQADKKEAGR